MFVGVIRSHHNGKLIMWKGLSLLLRNKETKEDWMNVEIAGADRAPRQDLVHISTPGKDAESVLSKLLGGG